MWQGCSAVLDQGRFPTAFRAIDITSVAIMFYYIWCSPIPLCVCNCLLFSFRYVLNFPIYRLISWFIELAVYFLKKERAWKALIICHLLRSYTQKSVLIIQIKICYVPSIENVCFWFWILKGDWWYL